MFFLIDNVYKIIFGWSPKCGCSHVKKIYYFLAKNKINCLIHVKNEYTKDLPNDIENYTVVIITRNPYKRIVSGFLNKYRLDGPFRSKWTQEIISFSGFVDELIKKNWNVIDRHHFIPQTKEKFNEEKIMRAKCIKCYEIENIDYNYLEELYNKKIPIELLNFRGNNRKKYDEDFNEPVYDLNMEDYYNFNVDVAHFYNQEIKDKVYNFYINDFIFFNKLGFDYAETI